MTLKKEIQGPICACLYLFIYLFGVLRRFQHCTGHITTGSWKGRGNQYIEFARVPYCKLPTNGKQLPAFPHKALMGSNPGLRGGRRECYHSATVAPCMLIEDMYIRIMDISHMKIYLSVCNIQGESTKNTPNLVIRRLPLVFQLKVESTKQVRVYSLCEYPKCGIRRTPLVFSWNAKATKQYASRSYPYIKI